MLLKIFLPNKDSAIPKRNSGDEKIFHLITGVIALFFFLFASNRNPQSGLSKERNLLVHETEKSRVDIRHGWIQVLQ